MAAYHFTYLERMAGSSENRTLPLTHIQAIFEPMRYSSIKLYPKKYSTYNSTLDGLNHSCEAENIKYCFRLTPL